MRWAIDVFPKLFLLYLAIALSASACGKTNITREEAHGIKQVLPDSVAFITMKIESDSLASASRLHILSINKKPGKIKTGAEKPINYSSYLTFMIYDSDSALIDSFSIEHPLYKSFEYVDENSQLTTKAVILKDAEFFIRIEMKNSKSMVIKETAAKGNAILLSKIELR